MESITPSQRTISNRFPVLSFNVSAPPERLFEIACATDPALFGSGERHRRTPANFFTTRSDGLLRAPAGRATYLVPSDQLARFAGAQRVYYALATHGSSVDDGLKFLPPPGRSEQIPYVILSPDFDGRSLDRRRLGAPRRLSGPQGALVWAGDVPSAPAPSAPAPSAPAWRPASPGAYDDGHDPSLWGPPAASAEQLSRYTGSHGAEWEAPTSVPSPEPPGLEHPLAGQETIRSYGGAIPEPPGREHPVGGALFGGAHEAATSGTLSRAEPAASTPEQCRTEPAVAAPPREISEPQALPTLAPYEPADAAVSEAAPEPWPAVAERLDIPAKFSILRPVAQHESGGNYGAISIDPVHGLAYGIVHFRQGDGKLGQVLAAFEQRDSAAFRRVFGADAPALRTALEASEPSARLAAVAGQPLKEEVWTRRFIAAAALEAMRAAQNQIAIEGFLDELIPVAAAWAFDTDRALAMLLDRAVHLGLGGARRWVAHAVLPLRRDREVADALRVLGTPDLPTFQRDVAGLAATGVLDGATHAALVGAVRGLGERAPFALPPLGECLDRMVRAARGTPWAARVADLRVTDQLADVRFVLE